MVPASLIYPRFQATIFLDTGVYRETLSCHQGLLSQWKWRIPGNGPKSNFQTEKCEFKSLLRYIDVIDRITFGKEITWDIMDETNAQQMDNVR